MPALGATRRLDLDAAPFGCEVVGRRSANVPAGHRRVEIVSLGQHVEFGPDTGHALSDSRVEDAEQLTEPGNPLFEHLRARRDHQLLAKPWQQPQKPVLYGTVACDALQDRVCAHLVPVLEPQPAVVAKPQVGVVAVRSGAEPCRPTLDDEHRVAGGCLADTDKLASEFSCVVGQTRFSAGLREPVEGTTNLFVGYLPRATGKHDSPPAGSNGRFWGARSRGAGSLAPGSLTRW